MSLLDERSNVLGLIAFLNEPLHQLRDISIRELLRTIDITWPVVAKHIDVVETIAKESSLETREHANFLISKICYHQEDYKKSLEHALLSGKLFNPEEDSDYVSAMMNTCIDEYKQYMERTQSVESVPEKIRDIVQGIFNKSIHCREYEKLLGIALSCGRLDVVRESIRHSDEKSVMMARLLKITTTGALHTRIRNQLLELIMDLFEEQNQVFLTFQCLVLLNKFTRLGDLLLHLLGPYPEASYQMAIDIFSIGNTNFSAGVIKHLEAKVASLPTETANHAKKLISIISGLEPRKLYRAFLERRSHIDERLVDKYCSFAGFSDEPNIQSALMLSYSLMSISCPNTLLASRSNWIKQAKSWNKFMIISSLGLPFIYSSENYSTLMTNYLSGTGAEEMAGSRFTYGILLMGQPNLMKTEILEDISTTVSSGKAEEVLLHGCCLSLGLVYTGSGNAAVLESLIHSITDKPVSGMAAGIAVGLVLVDADMPSILEVIHQTLTPIILETKHDKIAFGVALGIALSLYEKRDLCDELTASMLSHSNAYMRMAGALGSGLAYCGCDNALSVIQRLLSIISGDVSDLVRRCGVFGLGFIFVRSPLHMLPFAKLLLASYSPHVRYASSLVSGLICAGSASEQLLKLLTPLLDDSEDFVVQGACVGTSCVLMLAGEEQTKEASKFREKLIKIMEGKSASLSKEHSLLARQGAMLGAGLLDAGGRNCVVSLVSPLGVLRRNAILSAAIAVNFWEWFGLFNLMPNTLTPSAVIGVDLTLKLPRSFSTHCNSSPIRFEYVQPIPVRSSKEKEKKFGVSFTFQKKKEKDKSSLAKDEEAAKLEAEEKKKEEARKIPDFDLVNAVRVTHLQQPYLSVKKGQRYLPITLDPTISTRTRVPIGIVVLRDTDPSAGSDYIDLSKEDGLPAPKCPDSFVYTIPDRPDNADSGDNPNFHLLH